MQPRLMRSNSECIIAGVCGGLGEYFAIDPVFVRLIFVLVTVTSGLGLVVYPALWIAMPKARGQAAPGVPQQFGVQQDAAYNQQSYVRQEAAMHGQTAQARPAAAEPYRFDPLTGQQIGEPPARGQTLQLPNDPNLAYNGAPPAPDAQTARPPRRGWRFMGFVLLGIGILALADALKIDTDIVFPILMIGGGLLLLWRRGA